MCGYPTTINNPKIKADPVNSGSWSISTSNENWCNKDIEFKWDRPLNAQSFSIALSKYAGSDPGPNSDTYDTTFTFNNVTSGKWFVNIKSSYLGTWSNVTYWTIYVPTSEPSIYANVVHRDGKSDVLQYQISCLKTIYGPDDFINYLKLNDNSTTGDVELNNTNGVFVLKGIDNQDNAYYSTLSANITPTPNFTNGNSNGVVNFLFRFFDLFF
jgi:hypothetical protein